MPLLRKRRTDAQRVESFSPAWEVPGRFNFTRDVVDALAEDPTRSALTFVDAEGIVDRRSFAEISGDAARWAHLLRTRLDRGDRVLVMLGKSPSWHCALLGALKGGLVAVPCPDMLRARDLAFRVRHSGARLVIAERSCEVEVEEMRNQVDGTVAVLYLDEARNELTRYMPVAPTEDTTAGETALILYTSGTTKDPKGVVHTHAYTWAQRMQASHWLDAHENDVVWCTAGTGWAKAIWNVLLGPWSHGAEVVLHEGGFEPEERLALLQKLGVTILCQAPTEYRMLAKLDGLAGTYLPQLRHAVSAGEPLNPEVIERFQDALGLTIYDGYGQTENSLLVANTVETPIRPGSMGLPTPGHDVAVIDDAGHVCAPGEEGDLALIGRPPTLFTGYWEAPDDTDAAFRDGWYVTGDRAVRDEEGYLWFVGRADDVILSAAYRIGPFEVESALLEHPAVAESAVVGVPDPDRGQLVKAFVVLRQGHEPSGELAAELQEHVKSVTAPYKYPRAISFVDELPKTSSGKIRRVALRENPELGSPAAPTEPATFSLPRGLVDDNGVQRAAHEATPAAPARDEEAEAARQRREAELAARREAEAVAAERARAAAEEAARVEAEEQLRYEIEESTRREAEVGQGSHGGGRGCTTRVRGARRSRGGGGRSPRGRGTRTGRTGRGGTLPRGGRGGGLPPGRGGAYARRGRRAGARRSRGSPSPRRSRGRPHDAKPRRRRPAPKQRKPHDAKPRRRRPAPKQRKPHDAKPRRRRPAPKQRRPHDAKPRRRRPAPKQRKPHDAKPRSEARALEPGRRRSSAAEAERRAEAEAARREAEAQELARREADEAERREAEAAAAAAATAALEAATVGDVMLDDAEPETDAERRSWRAGRQARKEEAARAKREAEEAKQRAKEAEEQRKREEVRTREEARLQAEADKAATKQRAKDEAEQRKRDEAEAKQRAKDEAEQRKRDEIEAKQRAKDEAEQRKRDEVAAREDARRRELEAEEAAKRRAEVEKAELKQREEDERRLKKAQSKARRRRGLFEQPEEEPLAVDGEAEEPIPDLVARLQRYSNIPQQPSVSEDEPAER